MGDIADSGLLIAGAAIVAVILVVWFGFKLFLLPLRLIWRFGNTLGSQIGAIPLSLVLVWTVAVEPDFFIQLWRWFLRFGQALLYDTPRQFALLANQLQNACYGSSSSCSTSVTVALNQVWLTAIGNPIRDFVIPSSTPRVALIFAIGVTVAMAASRMPWTNQVPARNSFRTIVALGASFALALYLAIMAIIAIPVFGEKVADVVPNRAQLSDQLKQIVATIDPAGPSFDQLDSEKKSLPALDDIDPSIKVGVTQVWSIQLDLWQESRNRLAESAKNFSKEAADFAQTTESFFQVNNEGHIGELATKRHVGVLVSSFRLWISDYRANLDSCRNALSAGLGNFRNFHNALIVIKPQDSSTTFPYEALNAAAQQLNWRRCSDDLKPVSRDYLPARIGPGETLGPFGLAAGWLLQTESPELALIIGLLGFGFFGALAASFVKEFAATPGNDLPAIGFILPALVRGIGAAILVFLLAKGGTAILTRGDASPNAYAIFVACFVAAVFSEDVWAWARTRQSQQLSGQDASGQKRGQGNGGGTPPGPSPSGGGGGGAGPAQGGGGTPVTAQAGGGKTSAANPPAGSTAVAGLSQRASTPIAPRGPSATGAAGQAGSIDEKRRRKKLRQEGPRSR